MPDAKGELSLSAWRCPTKTATGQVGSTGSLSVAIIQVTYGVSADEAESWMSKRVPEWRSMASAASVSASAASNSLCRMRNSLASLAGDVPIGTSGTITISVHGSSTDVLADISGYYTTTTTGQKYHTINPTRLVDTRSGIGGTTGAVTANGTYTVTTSTTQQVTMATTPTLAAMATVTDTTAGGYATLYPTSTGRPAASNLNWGTGDTVANLTLTPTDSSGQISIYDNSSGTDDFVVDCSGYFT